MSAPSAMVLEGETRTIKDFRGVKGIKRYLQDLGFIRGKRVCVAGENASGMILMVEGVKTALNRGLAGKIMAEDQS